MKPLIYGLGEPDGELQLRFDVPSQLALSLQQRTESFRCAFLSPIDYARHGADYLIVPGVAVSSSARSNTVKLFINPSVTNIDRIAVDIRVTTEIILTKIILAEKFPNLASDTKTLQYIPMMASLEAMLQKADAALVVSPHPGRRGDDSPFALDLVDEWNDLTGLPYVHGFWVGHEEPEAEYVGGQLLRIKEEGMNHLNEIAHFISRDQRLDVKRCKEYLASFRYDFGQEEQDGLSEFIRFAYYHGVLPDVPDLNFFEIASPPAPTIQ